LIEKTEKFAKVARNEMTEAESKEEALVSPRILYRDEKAVLEEAEDIADLLHRDGFVLRCKTMDCEAIGTPCTDHITALAASSKILVIFKNFHFFQVF
jgi:hypothetical protein